MNKNRYQYRLLSCAVLCSLLFCACGREAEPPKENVTALSETVEEKTEAEEATKAEVTEEITTTPEEESVMPDLSEARNADEALALLIEDEGFRGCVRYGSGIKEEDSPQEVLQKLESCESIVLKEAAYGNAIYSLESLSLLPNLKQFVIDIDGWDDSVIEDFTPIA